MSQKPSLAFVKFAPLGPNVVCLKVGSAGTRDPPAVSPVPSRSTWSDPVVAELEAESSPLPDPVGAASTKRSNWALVKSTASGAENVALSNCVLAPLNLVPCRQQRQSQVGEPEVSFSFDCRVLHDTY